MPIRVEYGAFSWSGGVNPQVIKGPDRQTYVVEHMIPGREGGIIEYLGSKQPTYQFRGFWSPPSDGNYTANAGVFLSGSGYYGLNTDAAYQTFVGLRGSGAQLLRIDSTITNQSGYPVLYENSFFYIDKLTVGYEAGRTYPYYPYSIDFKGASTNTYGNSSGTTPFPGILASYFSGYIMSWTQVSGFPLGQTVIGIGFYAVSVASGNAKMAVYLSGGQTVQAQSASQPVNSGWNYFPLNPSFATTSGSAYTFALKSNITTNSGFAMLYIDDGVSPGNNTGFRSGEPFANDFPTNLTPNTTLSVSGIMFNGTLVTV